MGGKSGGNSYVPKEAADNLQSAQIAEIIDLIGEGEISQDIDLKRVYLNDTPVQNTNGTYNFSGIEFVGNKGVKDQNPLTGFDYVMRTVSVGTQVTKDSAIVRSITDPLVSRVVLTLGVSSLMQTTSKGDQLETSVALLIEFIKDGKTVKSEQVTFKGKTTSQYYADDSYSDLPAAPFEIRVSRVTADSTTSSLLNDTYFSTYTEIIDAKLSYPHSVVVGIRADSAQFGNQIPSRKYLVKGLIIQVPTNYDPVNRTYSGVWDGQFKPSWTDNPAWVFYDLVTNTRYGLGKVLGSFTCDKWALYEIAKYCDELVDDGYGGKEPRMTCNLQLSDEREAYDILNDLASVFRGISIWNGRELTVVNDRVTDPVALYTNSNVVDGNFSRSFVAKRAITTVVHVAYQDKREQYRTKTEYVSDDELVKRYGENVKSVTAFGCTSRGQAVRLGRWILETSRLEQQTISFKVGAEGLQHIPYDVIQVADKFWANEVIGGRVMSVDGNRVTLDTQVGDVVGGTFTYLKLDGTNKTLNITGLSSSRDVVTLSGVPEELSKGDVWSLIPANQVKPQLFRCLAIEENTEEGTYSVTAIEHNPAKGAMVDNGVRFDSSSTKTSNLVMKPVVYNPTVEVNGRELSLKFDSNALGSTLEYEFTVYKDGKVYLRTFKQSSPELNLSGLPNGVYIVKTRAKSEYGYSDYTEYGFTIDFNVTGLRTQPRTFAISLSWDWPDVVVSDLSVQLFYAKSSDFSNAVLLTTLPYPQTSYTLSGVGLSETYYFWARGVDAAGNQGQLTPPVQGRADNDPNPIIEQITGAITKSTLGQELIAQLNSDMLDVASDAVALEAAARAQALEAEAAARAQAIETEVANRTRDVKATADKAAADLLAKATELGTRITNTETVNSNQATLISAVTAAQGATAAGLEEERRARADGDTAEAAKRETLAAKVGQNEAAITTERNARVTADSAQAAETAALKSRVANAESGITNLQSTFADIEKARADEVKTLSAKVGGGGANLLPDSEFKYGLSKHLSSEVNTATKVVGFNFSATRTIEGKQVGYLKRSGAADSSVTNLAFAKVPVEKGKFYQISCYVQQATSNVSITNIYGRHYIGDVAQSASAGVVVRSISNTPPTNGTATTLDQMYRCVRNYQIPLDSEITHISVALGFGARTDENVSYQFFTNPMICEVDSLDAAPVPYSAGPDPLVGVSEAVFKETASVVADVNGKLQSTYSLKTEAIAGGRRVVSGLAVGVDGQTGDSQVLIYADKFGIVNPNTNAFDTPFVVSANAGGTATVALKGDFIASGTILGKHLAASQSIQAPVINGGTINSATLNSGSVNGGSINIGDGNFIVDSAGNLTAKSGRFEGVVTAEKLEGDVLKMYWFDNPETGLYRVTIPAASFERVFALMPVMMSSGIQRFSGVSAKLYVNGSLINTIALASQYVGSYKNYDHDRSKPVSIYVSTVNSINLTRTLNAGTAYTIDIRTENEGGSANLFPSLVAWVGRS